MIPYQRLLKWSETHEGVEYDYVIARGAGKPINKDIHPFDDYWIEGYYKGKSGKNDVPGMRLPYSQQDVADEFKKQGKEWRWE